MAFSAPAQPPPSPDPYKTASAQTGSNVNTAIANSYLSNVNTVGPQGSTTYTTDPSQNYTMTDSSGQTYQVPRFTQTTQLSPDQQKLYDLGVKTQQNIGQIGVDQSSRIGDVLGKPVDYADLKLDPNSFSADRQRVEQAMYDRMNPQLTRAREAEENRLVNQGFQRGTQAFTDAMGDIGRQENDARLAITAAGLGEQQGMYGMARDAAGYEMQRRTQQQNQPINAITALLSGSQVSMPNVPGYNPSQIAGTDVSGNVYNSAALANQNYAQKVAQQNAMMGGLFGMGSAAAFGGMKYGFNPMKWGAA